MNSNLFEFIRLEFELEIEKGKEIEEEKEKRNQNLTGPKLNPGPTQTSMENPTQSTSFSGPALSHLPLSRGPSPLSPRSPPTQQQTPADPASPRSACYSPQQRARVHASTRSRPNRTSPRWPSLPRPRSLVRVPAAAFHWQATPRVRPVVPAALARATAAAPARDSRGFPSQAEPPNHRRPSF